ncbi:TerB family tellurite resistance protein [uncultured Cohaesibacter sp.]|uniref:tellurite resistance TerB family protein n=1 Tax=uncultured Cohaesibacter sp. TaxID=1002546 RepID=UPI00292D2C74|nr:TerB family tellurite resistance protein [uncultured Cohaesibacter sp.]
MDFTMFDSLMRLFRDISGASEDRQALSEGDLRVATAALLVHLMSIDGIVDENETEKIRKVLQKHFSLTKSETSDLIKFASKQDEEAVDLFKFTSVIKRELDEEGRIELIEMMWQLVYADGHVHEFEDNLVWRVSELLGVSGRDRIRMRKHVQAQINVEPDE